MSQKTVCDSCDEAIAGKPKITSTENDGTKLDFCSTRCFIGFTTGKDASL